MIKILKFLIITIMLLNLLVTKGFSEANKICFHTAYKYVDHFNDCFLAKDILVGTIYVKKKAFLCEKDIKKATVISGKIKEPLWLYLASKLKKAKKVSGYVKIEFLLTDEGKSKINRISKSNIGNFIAIFIEKKLFSTQQIGYEINTNKIYINVMLSEQEANNILREINKADP